MNSSVSGTRRSFVRSLLAGLAAGSVAAVVASLLSLRLQSPDGAFFNTASVTFGTLLAGLAGGGIWWAVQRFRSPGRIYAACALAAFAFVSAAALLGQNLPGMALSGLASFVIPEATLALALVAVLTPALARFARPTVWLSPAALVVAAALGVGLAGHARVASGRLALPERLATASVGSLTPKDVAGQVFTVVADKSTATYTVQEKLANAPLPNNAVGKTSSISGTISLDGQPSTITVDLRTLQSDQALRDNFIRNRGSLMTSQHPYAVLTIPDLSSLLPSSYQEGQTISRNVTGTMTINDVQHPLTFAVEAQLQGGTLTVHGTTDFTWSDFQITPPNLDGFVQVDNNVHVEVLLVAQQGANSQAG